MIVDLECPASIADAIYLALGGLQQIPGVCPNDPHHYTDLLHNLADALSARACVCNQPQSVTVTL